MKLTAIVVFCFLLYANHTFLKDFLTVRMGRNIRCVVIDDSDIISYHEAGHAVASWFLEDNDFIIKVSVTPQKNGLGYERYFTNKTNCFTIEQLFNRICIALAPQATEKVIFNQQSVGFDEDMKKAKNAAYMLVLYEAMYHNLGYVRTDQRPDPYPKYTWDEIQTKIDEKLAVAFEVTKNLLIRRKNQLMKIADRLSIYGEIDFDGLVKILGPKPMSTSTKNKEVCG